MLDRPVYESLRTRHAHLARRVGHAVTYDPAVATFAAVDPVPGPQRWTDLAWLLGDGSLADMFSAADVPPAGWAPVFELDGLQLLGPALVPDFRLDGRGTLVELGREDVPEMLDLVERTQPGPFRPRTHELGTYLGIRVDGVLVAMAGERLRPPGFTEISAVCTAPEERGHGHASRLVGALVARIDARGERAFLHAVETNTSALRLYEQLGFRTRTRVTFRGFRIP
ncbi:GNAT family N-acetyltransferase [Rhodococcus sp. HNM0569]|uniref:GNAT family N-acetyltransferase n=1 Tax=Rhodococcus sp. HNM0569 TaxID=2716340 RepID=UPI00146C1B36|nr:GNAT family N-acetyltransferase [Rhodococcus sp. HNM0569]NLU85166.1 GNAT family N-acetyltransferase [Rhodococcus sp. HNM0569]